MKRGMRRRRKFFIEKNNRLKRIFNMILFLFNSSTVNSLLNLLNENEDDDEKGLRVYSGWRWKNQVNLFGHEKGLHVYLV